MELTSCRIVESPLDSSRVRLEGMVKYDDGGQEAYWFEFPAEHEGEISASGNPWVVAMLPLAMTLGEPLRVCRPIDPLLRERLPELMEIWKTWYPRLRVISIEAPTETLPPLNPQRNAAFFSGGIDSFFTVLRHRDGTDTWNSPVHDLISIAGFDIPLTNAERFERHRERLRETASELGMHLIEAWTNLRETRSKPLPWAGLHFGSVLISTALSLERRLQRVFIPASYTYNSLHPVASHPLTDRLFSTRGTQFFHDGAAFSRVQKTELVATDPLAMRALHVCFVLGNDENCGVCIKCCRTMAALELYGALNGRSPFQKPFSAERLGRIYCTDPTDRASMLQLRQVAVQKGRSDVIKAVDRSLRISSVLDRVLPITAWLGKKPWPVGKVGRRVGQKLLDRVIDC